MSRAATACAMASSTATFVGYDRLHFATVGREGGPRYFAAIDLVVVFFAGIGSQREERKEEECGTPDGRFFHVHDGVKLMGR